MLQHKLCWQHKIICFQTFSSPFAFARHKLILLVNAILLMSRRSHHQPTWWRIIIIFIQIKFHYSYICIFCQFVQFVYCSVSKPEISLRLTPPLVEKARWCEASESRNTPTQNKNYCQIVRLFFFLFLYYFASDFSMKEKRMSMTSKRAFEHTCEQSEKRNYIYTLRHSCKNNNNNP